ncbi:MAG: S1C family serine protease [Chloroflexota bacterium]
MVVEGEALTALSNSLADVVEGAGRSIVGVQARRHVPSSGTLWKEAVVVTANHTIERDDDIQVILPDGGTTPAKLAGRDPSTDLAVLRVEGGGLGPIQQAETESLRVGELVLAVARPGDHGLGASLGVLSALGESWRTWAGGKIDLFIRPDVTLYPGFSGGPLVNARGHVVGINTSGLSRSLPLTVPSSTVQRVVEQLLSKGRVARGFIGLGMQPVKLPEKLRQTIGHDRPTALLVVSVEPGGPADRAGILVGDVILGLSGIPLEDTRDVQAALGPESLGKAIPVDLIRGGRQETATITPVERPEKAGRHDR